MTTVARSLGSRAAVWVALALVVTACTGDADRTDGDLPDPVDATAAPDAAGVPPTPVEGGTVRYGLRAEPDNLNPWAAESVAATLPIAQTVLAPLSRVTPDGTFEPWLLAVEPQASDDDPTAPFEVVYDLRDDAQWSDGQPIDGGDLLFTLAQCRQQTRSDTPPATCDAIDLRRSSSDGQRATVTFTRPVAGWLRPLDGLPVLPEHLLRDADTDSAWQDRLPVASGPFRFASWTPGERIALTRNDRWWGGPVGLDRLEFVFADDIGVADVQRGVVDVVTAQATLGDIERARADSDVRVAVGPGTAWTAVDLNLAAPGLARPAVRRAVAAALDRQVIVDELVRPMTPAVGPRDGLLIDGRAAPQPLSTPAPGTAGGDLDAAGCTRDDDGIYRCDDQRMTLRLTTSGDDPYHQVVGEYLTSQLGRAGVELVPGGSAATDGWDIRLASVATTDPAQIGRRWRCGAPDNDQSFCNPELDTLLARAARTRPEPARDALYQEAELLLASDRPTIPLYAVPTMLVYRTTLEGPTLDAGPDGVIWNVDQWVRTRSPAPTNRADLPE